MVFFIDSDTDIYKLDRIISQPNGSVLLVGRSGVGRRTATMLACHMNRLEFVSPAMSVDYSLKCMHTHTLS